MEEPFYHFYSKKPSHKGVLGLHGFYMAFFAFDFFTKDIPVLVDVWWSPRCWRCSRWLEQSRVTWWKVSLAPDTCPSGNFECKTDIQ